MSGSAPFRSGPPALWDAQASLLDEAHYKASHTARRVYATCKSHGSLLASVNDLAARDPDTGDVRLLLPGVLYLNTMDRARLASSRSHADAHKGTGVRFEIGDRSVIKAAIIEGGPSRPDRSVTGWCAKGGHHVEVDLPSLRSDLLAARSTGDEVRRRVVA